MFATRTAHSARFAQKPEGHPDLILFGGRVFTASPVTPWAEAIAIRGERILVVGSNSLVRSLQGPRTRVIDLKGHVVIPGINDTHTHLGYSASVGATIQGEERDWIQGPDPTRLLDALADLAKRTPKSKWLRGRMGLAIRHSSLRREALDQVAPEHRVLLIPTYGHGSMVNTPALRFLRLGESSPDPVGGWYERKPGSRDLTGLLDGSAQYDAFNAYYSSERSVLVQELRKDATAALRYGITTLQHMPSILNATETQRVFQEADLPVRVRIIAWPYPGRTADWKRIRQPRLTKRTYLSGIKYVIDGTPLEQWALMRQEYAGRPGWHGRLYYSESAIRRILTEALESKEPLALHVVGDRTAELILQMMGTLASDVTWRSRRVRFEHANGVTGANIASASRLGVIVSQPRMDGMQMRECQRGGVRLAHGSDGEPGNPWVDLVNATKGRGPDPGLSREDAVRMFTRGSAFAEFTDTQKGTLAVGMLADIVVLSQDIFTVPSEQLPATTSLLTLIGGKVEYDAGVLAVRK